MTAPDMGGAGEFRAYGYRWVVLGVFGLVVLVQGFLWLSFAPIESSVEGALGVSAAQVRLLALIGPLMFVFFASAAGSLADRRGFKFAVSLGGGLLVAGGALRVLVANLGLAGNVQYWLFLACQAVCGVGGLFCLTNMSKVPVKWFPVRQRALGTGLATVSMYIGNALALVFVTGLAAVPQGTSDVAVMQAGLSRVLLVVVALMAVAVAVFMAFAREDPPTPSGPSGEEHRMSLLESLRSFTRIRSFRAFCFVSFVGYGTYVSLTVTMEKIMAYHGFTTTFASYVASAVTVSGIAGAVLLPPLSERIGVRKPFMIASTIVPVPALLIVAFMGNKALALASATALGFFLLPALPITFTMVAEMEEIGPRLAGTAAGTLLAVGSVGSVGVPLLLEAFKRGGEAGDYRFALLFMAVLGVLACAIAVRGIRETGLGRLGRVPGDREGQLGPTGT